MIMEFTKQLNELWESKLIAKAVELTGDLKEAS